MYTLLETVLKILMFIAVIFQSVTNFLVNFHTIV